MLNTFIRCTLNDDYRNPLMYYYCFIRMQNILTMEYSIHNSAVSMTPYYELTCGLIKKILHMPGFPLVPKKTLYMFMIPKEISYGETQYPTFNWKQIWKNFSSIIFNPYEKETIFKHLHLCLATNDRLALMGRSESSKCNKCTGDWNHTALHMFYQCEFINPLFL